MSSEKILVNQDKIICALIPYFNQCDLQGLIVISVSSLILSFKRCFEDTILSMNILGLIGKNKFKKLFLLFGNIVGLIIILSCLLQLIRALSIDASVLNLLPLKLEIFDEYQRVIFPKSRYFKIKDSLIHLIFSILWLILFNVTTIFNIHLLIWSFLLKKAKISEQKYTVKSVNFIKWNY